MRSCIEIGAIMTSLEEPVRIEDYDFYDNASCYPVYERLQRERPVYYYEPLDMWVLSKYDDVRHVSRTPNTFSSTRGLTLNEIRLARSGAGKSLERFFDPAGELVITLDPPRHRQLKQTMTPAFNPRAVRSLEPQITALSNQLLDQIQAGEPIDFVATTARKLPVLVAAAVLGVPDADPDQIQVWVDALEALTRVETVAELEAAAANFKPMDEFFRAHLAQRRKQPGDDLMSVLLATRLEGEPLTEPQMLSHLMTLMSNGGTTRLLLASLVWLFAAHPEDLARVVAEPGLQASAIEEALRLCPPARGFARTVVDDAVLRGVTMRAGQHVYMLYDAANRDAEIFADPHAFDVARHQERMHVSFGYGTHTCLGAALIRVEVGIFVRELLRRFTRIELAGEPVRQQHVQLNGWQRLPVVFGK
jgi:cytochrome P450